MQFLRMTQKFVKKNNLVCFLIKSFLYQALFCYILMTKQQKGLNMTVWPKKIFIYTDGASRGNPGPCALGLQVFDSNYKLIYEEAGYLEEKNTNNFSEYKAVIRALELSVTHKIQELHLFSDSQFLIRQLEKKYKVKSANIKPLFEKCQELLKKIPKWTFEHIPREQNKGADALANKALDEKEKF